MKCMGRSKYFILVANAVKKAETVNNENEQNNKHPDRDMGVIGT